MTDEIIIDGAIFNECNGCPLYDGDICTGARLDEEISEKDTNICNEHLAEQFWVVQRQLKLKQQECEELKEKIKKYSKINEQDTRDFANYKQALDEIEEFCTVYSANHDAYEMVYKDILAFINKAKEGNNDR